VHVWSAAAGRRFFCTSLEVKALSSQRTPKISALNFIVSLKIKPLGALLTVWLPPRLKFCPASGLNKRAEEYRNAAGSVVA